MLSEPHKRQEVVHWELPLHVQWGRKDRENRAASEGHSHSLVGLQEHLALSKHGDKVDLWCTLCKNGKKWTVYFRKAFLWLKYWRSRNSNIYSFFFLNFLCREPVARLQLLSHPHIEIPRKLLPLQTARVLSFLKVWPIRLTKLLNTEEKISEGTVLCGFLPFVCLSLLKWFLYHFNISSSVYDHKTVLICYEKDTENIESKMESPVFLIPASEMPPAGFIAHVLMSCFQYTSYYTRISFLMALPCVTLIVYLTISCFIHKWFVLYTMTLCCTCKELQFVSVLFDHVQCHIKSSILSAHFNAAALWNILYKPAPLW